MKKKKEKKPLTIEELKQVTSWAIRNAEEARGLITGEAFVVFEFEQD